MSKLPEAKLEDMCSEMIKKQSMVAPCSDSVIQL